MCCNYQATQVVPEVIHNPLFHRDFRWFRALQNGHIFKLLFLLVFFLWTPFYPQRRR